MEESKSNRISYQSQWSIFILSITFFHVLCRHQTFVVFSFKFDFYYCLFWEESVVSDNGFL